MRKQIVFCTCAVALMLVTECFRAEAADRNEVVSADPNASSPKNPVIEVPADPQTGAQAAQAIPLEEVPGRAVATRVELNALLPAAAFRQTLERISSELDRALPEVASRLAKTREVLAGRPNLRTLQNLEAELSEMRERLRPLDEELDKQLAGLRAALQQLETLAAVWEATAKVSRREGAATSTVTRIANDHVT